MLSPIVQSFIKENIQSVWQLELLLYIRARADSLRTHDLAAALYTSPDAVEHTLQYFEKCGLLQKGKYDKSEYVYAPISAALKESVDQTARAYVERKVTLIQYIFSNPNIYKTGHKSTQGYLDLQRRYMDNDK